jgi:hypothetical protein
MEAKFSQQFSMTPKDTHGEDAYLDNFFTFKIQIFFDRHAIVFVKRMPMQKERQREEKRRKRRRAKMKKRR